MYTLKTFIESFKKNYPEETKLLENIEEIKPISSGSQLNAECIQQALNLIEHPEGGFYREFIRSKGDFTVIFYLLPKGAVSSWHSLKDTEEKFELISGAPLSIPKLNQTGTWKSEEELTYANSVIIEKSENGDFGDWFGAYSKGEYSLVTCRCSPPFEFEKFKLLTKSYLAKFLEKNPDHLTIINKLTAMSLREASVNISTVSMRP